MLPINGFAPRIPFTISPTIAQTVAPQTTGQLRTIVAGSVFEAGQMAATGAAFSGLGILSPLISMASQAAAGSISGYPAGLMMPNIMQRAAMTGGFAGMASPYIGAALGGYQPGGMAYNVGQPGASLAYNPYAAAATGATSTAAAATAGAGFMPTGDSALDIANSIANMPTYSPAEQSLLNQIQDPQQRAMQELQMFMQKQALLATTLSNIANMRHEMMKTVANNLRA
jgi:hypothetical protein